MLQPKARVAAFGPKLVLCALPVTTPSDDRSPVAKAYQWASRIIIVAMEMVLPGLAGYWLDQQLGTLVLFMVVGFLGGTTWAVIHLVRMTRADERGSRDGKA